MQNSPNQHDPDQDQRKDSSLEDPTSMRIEFLRARLLAERSVSKIARQRADELAKRVLELEEELKFVSLQRKKAEKAATDVLAILENHGMSEVSDDFDSTSDQEVIHCESQVGHNSPEEEESSVGSKMRRNHTDELSSSELESSPLPGRRLPWKGGQDSSRSCKKKYTDSPTRRRNSSVSTTSSSPGRRIGKSCRQIRRREARLAAESQRDNTMLAPQQNGVASFSEGFRTHYDSGTEILREGSEQDPNIFFGGTVSGDLENKKPVANGSNYLNGRGNDEDMERALAHQAQLIGQYEDEEKAQREWEEKFRENNSSTPDSCGHGNHSDVTEERDEPKADAPPHHVVTTASRDQKAKSKAEDVESSESQPNGFQSPPQVDLRCFQDQKSQPSDFEFPVAIGNQNQQSSEGNQSVPPPYSSHHHTSQLEGPTGNQSAQIVPSESKNKHCALIPHETPDTVVSVLEALHQAKLSLKHNAINALPPMDSALVGKAIEFSVGDTRPEVPVGCPELFRVPSDFHVETSAKSHFPGSNSRLSLSKTNHYPDSGNALTADRFTVPFTESLSSVTPRSRNFSIPANLYMESRLKNLSWDMPKTSSRFPHRNPFSGPSFGTTLPLSGRYPYNDPRYPYNDPNTDGAALVSSSTYTSPAYPFYADLMPRMPSEEGRRLFSSTGAIPPPNRFSFYDDNIRPNHASSSKYASPATYPYPDSMPKIPSGEEQRIFSNSGAGISPPNRFAFENDRFRPNTYR